MTTSISAANTQLSVNALIEFEHKASSSHPTLLRVAYNREGGFLETFSPNLLQQELRRLEFGSCATSKVASFLFTHRETLFPSPELSLANLRAKLQRYCEHRWYDSEKSAIASIEGLEEYFSNEQAFAKTVNEIQNSSKKTASHYVSNLLALVKNTSANNAGRILNLLDKHKASLPEIPFIFSASAKDRLLRTQPEQLARIISYERLQGVLTTRSYYQKKLDEAIEKCDKTTLETLGKLFKGSLLELLGTGLDQGNFIHRAIVKQIPWKRIKLVFECIKCKSPFKAELLKLTDCSNCTPFQSLFNLDSTEGAATQYIEEMSYQLLSLSLRLHKKGFSNCLPFFFKPNHIPHIPLVLQSYFEKAVNWDILILASEPGEISYINKWLGEYLLVASLDDIIEFKKWFIKGSDSWIPLPYNLAHTKNLQAFLTADAQGNTLLHVAMNNPELSANPNIIFKLTTFCKPEIMTKLALPNHLGMTPLHLALENGLAPEHFDKFIFNLTENSPLQLERFYTPDEQGTTLLHYAPNIALAEKILNKCPADLRKNVYNPASLPKGIKSPLHRILKRAHDDIVTARRFFENLPQTELDLVFRLQVYGATPFHHCADWSLSKLLLSRYSGDLQTAFGKDNCGRTPLHTLTASLLPFSAEDFQDYLKKCPIECLADNFSPDDTGKTPLHYILEKTTRENLSKFLKAYPAEYLPIAADKNLFKLLIALGQDPAIIFNAIDDSEENAKFACLAALAELKENLPKYIKEFQAKGTEAIRKSAKYEALVDKLRRDNQAKLQQFLKEHFSTLDKESKNGCFWALSPTANAAYINGIPDSEKQRVLRSFKNLPRFGSGKSRHSRIAQFFLELDKLPQKESENLLDCIPAYAYAFAASLPEYHSALFAIMPMLPEHLKMAIIPQLSAENLAACCQKKDKTILQYTSNRQKQDYVREVMHNAFKDSDLMTLTKELEEIKASPSGSQRDGKKLHLQQRVSEAKTLVEKSAKLFACIIHAAIGEGSENTKTALNELRVYLANIPARRHKLDQLIKGIRSIPLSQNYDPAGKFIDPVTYCVMTRPLQLPGIYAEGIISISESHLDASYYENPVYKNSTRVTAMGEEWYNPLNNHWLPAQLFIPDQQLAKKIDAWKQTHPGWEIH